MLNCFKNYEICINSLNCTVDMAWPRYVKLTLEQQYMLSILHNMHADARATLGASVSAGMVLTPKAEISLLQHQKS